MQQVCLAVIGGGIVGLSTAYQFQQRFPGRRVIVLEKEGQVAAHQTGHNSGVLHSGIYYKPGSLKAVNCRAGKLAMEAFCAAEGIALEICGKVIVACDESELPALHKLHERGHANDVKCVLIGQERLRELEPHVKGVAALHVPETGIVAYKQVCARLVQRVVDNGGEVYTRARVNALLRRSTTVVVQSTAEEVEAQVVVNCAGLHCDRVAALDVRQRDAQIVPFRGEYFALKPAAEHLCRNLIYPVPDARYPFLGVHFTRMIEGGVECGPNAVLAFAREGYRKTDLDVCDLLQTVTYPGFLRMARRHWRMGLGELWRSLNKAAFVRALQRLLPAIQADDLIAAPAGIRAQAVARDGSLVDDFLIRTHERMVHVLNAPSPAATASLMIGQQIVDHLATRLNQVVSRERRRVDGS
jgi:(S)-2-hydroxyglutarate dehydrogenase